MKKRNKASEIRARLSRHGYVTRNWALSKRISRLSDNIFVLKKQGWRFTTVECITSYGGFKEPDYKYIVIRVGA